MSDVTRILQAIQQGDTKATEELFPIVYEELRRLAGRKMAAEGPDHTLQPTILVHDAWERLVGSGQHWENRRHFFSAAATVMERMLVDHARRKLCQKRGGQFERTDLDHIELALPSPPEEFLALHDALERLAAVKAVAAELVKLRHIVGLTEVEAIEQLGLTRNDGRKLWNFAQAWLAREVRRSLGGSD